MSQYESEPVSRSDCKPWRDESTLRHFYVDKRYSIGKTARTLGCSSATISVRLDDLPIKKRSISEQKREDTTPDQLEDGKEYLQREYVEKERSIRDIANELDVATRTVHLWLERHGIGSRDLTTAQRLRGPPELRDRETLREMYVDKELSGREIAKRIGSSPRSVHRRLHAYGIEVRGVGMKGEKHWGWKGGLREDYYGVEWIEQSRKCRERDNHTCQLCGSDGGERRLDVHHIVPFREFEESREANRLDNLVALCRSCHMRAERYAPLMPEVYDP